MGEIASGNTVLIVEDNENLARTLSRLITFPYIAKSVGCVADALRGLEQIQELRSLVVDIKLPDGNGLQVAEEARGRSPTLPILVITGYSNHSNINRAARMGALYLSKPLDGINLANLRASILGELYFYRLARLESQASALALTPRGKEIAALAISGLNGSDISAVLGISRNTYKTEVSFLFRKLNVGSLQQLIIRLLSSPTPSDGTT